MDELKNYRVTFYTNVVFPTADDVDQDQFTRFYQAKSINDVEEMVTDDLTKNLFLKDMNMKSHWYYKTADVTSFTIKEPEGE